MEQGPLVLIIVYAYNLERYLFKCLDRILARILTDSEVITISGGCTDSCRKIVDGYLQKDEGIKVIHKKLQKNTQQVFFIQNQKY